MQIKVLATFVPEMALACDKFMTDVIESKLSSSSSGSGSGSATEQAPSATVAVYEPVRRFLIEMPLRLILGLGDTAPDVVSHLFNDFFWSQHRRFESAGTITVIVLNSVFIRLYGSAITTSSCSSQ
jgi:hypothetical protein